MPGTEYADAASMKPLLLVSLVAALFPACVGSSIESATDDVTESGCEARFHWLQKDAYRSTAGRSFDFWPAHTTTQLEVVCDGDIVATRSMANHGTDVGAVDANGDVILVETKVVSGVAGSRAELLALVESFAHCECDGATTFFSLDAGDGKAARDLMNELVVYLEKNVDCPDGVAELVALLKEGDVESALVALPNCTWKNGTSLIEGLDAAIAHIAETSKQQLADYHVCNNDAQLQAELFTTFATTGKVHACDATSALCHGPAWFYTP